MGQLALLGGAPIVQTPFSDWPVFDQREVEATRAIAASGIWDSTHPVVAELEAQFSAFHDTCHGLTVTNGSQTMEIILRGLGVGRGDEVIVPAFTFLATATAVLMVGATPIIVDICPKTFTLDPEAVKTAITPRTKAVMPVHIAGVTGTINEIVQIAAQHQLFVIEDCAHAHGSQSRGRSAGSFGNAGSFSFQGGKVITAGEGGMITTNDEDLYQNCWSQREGGQRQGKDPANCYVVGSNYRMTAFQAAVVQVQFERFQQQIPQKLENIARLDAGLSQIDGITPQYRHPQDRAPGYLYMFYYDAKAFNGLSRYLFVKALEAEGIPCGEAGYPPLYKTPLFQNRNFGPGGQVMSKDWGGHPFPDYASLSLPNVEQVVQDVVIFPHANLLAESEQMQGIIDAVQKIQHQARQWPAFTNTIAFGAAALSRKVSSKLQRLRHR
ncbi:MAG: DegT/DnrJ/EryC1/StrS family aminotransferase [Thermosynechococcaceae cyanobacterium]